MSILRAAIIAASLISAVPVGAQYFPPPPPPPGYYPPPGYDRPQRGYERAPRGYDQGYGRRGDPYERPRQARVGYTCATSRGFCELDYARPMNSSCSCSIPGFGRKRGAVTR